MNHDFLIIRVRFRSPINQLHFGLLQTFRMMSERKWWEAGDAQVPSQCPTDHVTHDGLACSSCSSTSCACSSGSSHRNSSAWIISPIAFRCCDFPPHPPNTLLVKREKKNFCHGPKSDISDHACPGHRAVGSGLM